jgi:lipopolysaccharide biosynthesis glycosyltransferase
MTLTSRPDSNREIVVVSATDDGYAMPLAVTVRSALDQLGADLRMRLYVLDGGLSDQSKDMLLRSWNDPRITVEWIRPDMQLVRDLKISEHVNVVTYLRLLMPLVLPAHVSRVIFMDADLLVRRNLGELWAEPQGSHAVLAVQDVAAPRYDAATLPTFDRCGKYLCAHTPIANYRELGLAPDGEYFNGGLLVADLDHWRRERYAEKMLACLRDHREHVLWWDQYALNVVMAGRWRALDPRWNQGAHVYAYPNWESSPLDQETFVQLQKAPWIVHFCSPSKPWQYFCRHPFTSDFRKCLKRTQWKQWQPERPDPFVLRWCQFHYQPLRNAWKTQVRALKRAVRRSGKRAA